MECALVKCNAICGIMAGQKRTELKRLLNQNPAANRRLSLFEYRFGYRLRISRAANRLLG